MLRLLLRDNEQRNGTHITNIALLQIIDYTATRVAPLRVPSNERLSRCAYAAVRKIAVVRVRGRKIKGSRRGGAIACGRTNVRGSTILGLQRTSLARVAYDNFFHVKRRKKGTPRGNTSTFKLSLTFLPGFASIR